jgi:hypothetical protein
MYSSAHSFIETLENVQTPPYSLQQIPGFPYDEFSERIRIYTEAESWYTGKVLEDIKIVKGENVEVYPVKINPIRTAVQKHVYALFGEVGEDDRPLVSARFVFHSDGERALAETAEHILNQIWYESNGRAIQWQNGALSQVYGGCIFKIAYDPLDKLRTFPLRIENPHPKYFIGVPSANDIYRLREAWFVKPVSWDEAKENGYDGSIDGSQTPWLVEHYTDTLYEATVQGQPVKRWADGKWHDVTRDGWGFVPAVYIPHIRVNGFYGENMFDHTKGVVKELNLRVADFGDAVNADSHAYSWMRNVQGSPDVITIAPGLNAINLGNSMAFSGNANEPEMESLGKDRASQPMQDLATALYDQFRRDCFIPKVADGEDEGSQRSGLTLAMRMLSLTWHTSSERVFWTAGLNLLNKMLIRMCIEAVPEAGLQISHASLRTKLDWAPVLPRDREMLINEVVARMGSNVSAPETLFGILGDIQDTDEEIKAILEFQEKLAEATAKGAQKGAPPPTTGAKPVSKGTISRSASEKSE